MYLVGKQLGYTLGNEANEQGLQEIKKYKQEIGEGIVRKQCKAISPGEEGRGMRNAMKRKWEMGKGRFEEGGKKGGLASEL